MLKRQYFGCKVIQREDSNTVPFFVFHARARDIKQWAGIQRVKDSPEGIQRVLRPTRRDAIKKFLSSFPANTIPNSLLLAFDFSSEELNFQSLDQQLTTCLPSGVNLYNGCEGNINWGTIEFSFDPSSPEHLKPALIVDGQHRLHGICDYQNEDLPLLVVSLINASVQEQAFQFVVINSKAIRVPTDNVKSIIANIDEEELLARLLPAGVSYGNKSPVLREINDLDSSPFQHLLDWDYNRNGPHIVKPSAIEQSIRYLEKLFMLEEDIDSSLEIFCAIWRAVKVSYTGLWGTDNQLAKKVSINALNEFISDRLKYAWEMSMLNIFAPQRVEEQTLNIVNLLPESFWAEKWTVSIKDNSVFRDLIKSDLEKLANNSRLGRPWKQGLRLPPQSDADEDE
jgi:DGQHR domain-containing protein